MTLDEFADRCDWVLAAKTLAGLRKATHDLPALPGTAAALPVPGHNDRQLMPAFAALH